MQTRTSVASFFHREDQGPTNIVVSDDAIQSGVNRLGINLGSQSFYDSGQLMKNLVYRNPGFEGSTWQVILRCATASATSCIDRDEWAAWPDNFLMGASFEFISGRPAGETGKVLASIAADSKSHRGVGVTFDALARAPAAGDYVIVRMEKPGDAQKGWWVDMHGGAQASTELSDLPPHSAGKQALRITASGAGQGGTVSSYFDSMEHHSFVQMRGPYQLSFKAKGEGGNNKLEVNLTRNVNGGVKRYFGTTVKLSGEWKTYSFDFTADDDGSSRGHGGVEFWCGRFKLADG